MPREPRDTPREPKVYLSRKARELGRLLAKDGSEEGNEVRGRLLELIFRTPLYVGSNGNCDVLTKYASDCESSNTVTSIRGYIGMYILALLYGSRQDFVVIHKGEPVFEPPEPVEKGIPLEEVMRKLDSEKSLDEILESSLGIQFEEEEEVTDPYQLRRREVLMNRMTRTEVRKERIRIKEVLRTDPRYKDATIVPFCEIKDYRLI